MTAPSAPHATRHLRTSDLRAAALLATQATQAVAAITEGVHQAVWRTLGIPGGPRPGSTRGLTGWVYRSVNGVAGLLGHGAARALARLEPLLTGLQGPTAETPERAAVIAALNGILGDRLHTANNPLATPMTLRLHDPLIGSQTRSTNALTTNSPATAAPTGGGAVSARLLLVIHGLCMNDLQWTVQRPDGHFNHAQALADALGYTPVYLRYNTGLHISQNAQTLAAQLDDLLARWPQPVTELSVLAHSMGGLLIRSALHAAQAEARHWPQMLRNIVFLGTPHHGAPLERAGNWVDVLLGSTPYTRPFAKLGQLRSAGVTDLRYGYLVDADWQSLDRFHHRPESHHHLPLPAGVRCFAVAATLGARRDLLAERLLGDGLVPLRSALGQHRDAQRCLHFAADKPFIAYRTGHLQLLQSPAVAQQLLRWLG